LSHANGRMGSAMRLRLLLAALIACIGVLIHVNSAPLQGYISNAEGHIGVRVSSTGGVNYIHPDSPADKAGIRVRDQIVTVNGRKHAKDDITGPPGTTVKLEIQRGKETLTFIVERIDYREIKP
jgi:C-terminal processing protease CtpA/Prc